MKTVCKHLLTFFVTLFLCTMLFACSKLTQENFDQIKLGMTMKQVTTILGNPTNVEKIHIAGIAGVAATWKDDRGQIDIQFLNERVTVKAFSAFNKNADEKPETT